jgi:hypothetical protein
MTRAEKGAETVAKLGDLEQAERELERWQIIVDYLRSQRPAPARVRAPHQNGRVTVAEAAAQALEAAGAPMPVRDLLAVVQKTAKIKDTEGLAKTLGRFPDRFEKTGRGVWALKPS